MSKPTQFYCEYVTRWIEDEAPETTLENFRSLEDANRCFEAHLDALPQIFERTNIRDVTPEDEPIRGLIWIFDEELIAEAP